MPIPHIFLFSQLYLRAFVCAPSNFIYTFFLTIVYAPLKLYICAPSNSYFQIDQISIILENNNHDHDEVDDLGVSMAVVTAFLIYLYSYCLSFYHLVI